ncbi:MAG TPA: alpha/beta hydrolase [Dongiaceae bacterium]|jgi:pimeloyl-ACP methyl ester carboxylesterase
MASSVEHHFLGLSPAGFHRVRYLEWGANDGRPTVLCVHGLTRNAHDFDRLAEQLAKRYRVISVDVVGRGGSAWLADSAHYTYAQYQTDITALIARLEVEHVHWIGTSMGGLIGMFMASVPNTPLASLLLNDVGPVIPKAALQRIADYVGLENRFSSLEALERNIRKVHAPFGPLTEEQWAHLVRHGHRRLPDGSYGLAYDPAIAENVKKGVADVDLWNYWDRISVSTMVLRGAESDLLSAATAEEMTRRGPRARLAELSGIGHAPALMAEDQIAMIESWLAEQL